MRILDVINKKYLDIIFSISVFFVTFVTIWYLPSYNLIRNFLLILNAIYLVAIYIKNFKSIVRKEITCFDVLVLLFLIYTFINAMQNNGISTQYSNFSVTFVHCFSLIELLLFLKYQTLKKEFHFTLKIILYFSVFLILLNDLLLFAAPNLSFSIESNVYYMLGNKFHLAEFHIRTAVLYMILAFTDRKNRFMDIKLLVLIILSFVIALYTDCATGVVEATLLLIGCILGKHWKKVISKKRFILVTMLLMALFPVLYKYILEIPLVEWLIVDVLNSDISLTHRTHIYENIFEIISQRPLYGFGYNNSYSIVSTLLGFPNSQNAFIDMILERGIIGSMLFVAVVISAYKKSENGPYGMYLYIFICVIIGMIEITYNTSFIGCLILLYFLKFNSENKIISY